MTSDRAKQSRLDRLVGWFSPTLGMKRARARLLTEAMLSYDAAKVGRRTDGWRSTAGSADSALTPFQGLLRDRARDLVRNNPYAAKGLSVRVANVIGTGIMCQAAGPNLRVNRRVDERWARWMDRCDLTGKLDFYGIQSQLERTRSEAGESLAIFTPTRAVDAFDVPFRLQVLEPDHIDDTKHTVLPNGNVVRHGIEYAGGRVAAFWLFDVHPGDDSPARFYRGLGNQSRRVPAENVIHYFKPLRPGQSRGVTDFAPVMIRLRMLDDFADAELMRKTISASIVGTIQTPVTLPDAGFSAVEPDPKDAKRQLQHFAPGMWQYLNPGEVPTFNDPKPSEDYRDFNNVELHAVAAGYNVPHELLTGDLSEVNYSSLRMGFVQFQALVESDQWQLTVPQVCGRVTSRWIEEASAVDPMIDARVVWDYTPPRFALLDPAKEVPAQIEAIQGGVMSYQNTVRREGYDWRKQLDELKEVQDYCRENGISMTSIPSTAPPAPAPSPPPSSTDRDDNEVEEEEEEAA